MHAIFLMKEIYNNYSMSPRWIWSDKITNERVAILRVPKGGVPGALEPWNFCCGARSPNIFTDWSPDTFLAVEPGAQRNFERSPEPHIFKFDHSSSPLQYGILHWFLITAFLCLFVRVNGHKETESEESTVHNTSIRGYYGKNVERDKNNFIVNRCSS